MLGVLCHIAKRRRSIELGGIGSAVPGTVPSGDRRAARTLSEPRKHAFGKMPLDPENKVHGDRVRGGCQLPAALALMLQAAAVTPNIEPVPTSTPR
jgi:hypothetical protein